MLCTFPFGCFQIYQNKSAKNIAIYYIGMIVPIKCMPKISDVGLFCHDKFENNQTRTRTTFFRTSKLTEFYFRFTYIFLIEYIFAIKNNVFVDVNTTLQTVVFMDCSSEWVVCIATVLGIIKGSKANNFAKL